MIFSVVKALGITQAWFAEGFREGNTLERICIFPSWLVFRLLFLGAYGLLVLKHRMARGS